MPRLFLSALCIKLKGSLLLLPEAYGRGEVEFLAYLFLKRQERHLSFLVWLHLYQMFGSLWTMTYKPYLLCVCEAGKPVVVV